MTKIVFYIKKLYLISKLKIENCFLYNFTISFNKMPELPEVEVICLGIKSHILGKTIIRTIIRNRYLRLPVSSKIYTIKNEMILNLKRRGKYILLELSSGWIIIHLGMSGRLAILNEEVLPQKHDHIDMIMSDHKVIRYTDTRRFGMWLWTEELDSNNLLKKIGPEPLSDKFNVNYLFTKCCKKKSSIKSLIMDTKLVAGIGNIYANESLFIAKINPIKPAYLISNNEFELLIKSIKWVLKSAIKYGGTTLRDFLDCNSKPGSFIKKLQVYGRKGKYCLICKTPIVSFYHFQRITFYCPNCQK